jgi:predicted phosphodiesterase
VRVALISDIHGNLGALDAVLAHLADQAVDATWNLGDILSGPLDAAATAERLLPLDLLTLAGNHERQLLACAAGPGKPSDQFAFERTTPAHHAWLRALPATAWPRPDIFLCHGRPSVDDESLLETDVPGVGTRLATADEIRARLGDVRAELVACGHSHIARAVWVGGCLVVNPGSVGLPAYEYQDAGVTYFVDNGAPHASYAIVDDAGGRWSASFFRVPYDWTAAGDLAERHGRRDWAHALRTGFAKR